MMRRLCAALCGLGSGGFGWKSPELHRIIWISTLLTIALLVEQLAFGRSFMDEPVRLVINAVRSDALDDVMGALTWLGRGELLSVLVIGCAAIAWWRGEPSAVRFLIAAGLGAAVLTAALKLLVGRERPELFERMVPASGYSFPSGHSLGSMAVYGAVALWLGGQGQAVWRRSVMGGAVALALVVGVSRVYLRVHYPSDVVAGLALGYILIALLALRAAPGARRRRGS